MTVALFVVKSTIDREHEADFNRWYNEEHIPYILAYPGVVSARRYRTIIGQPEAVERGEAAEFLAVYEFQDEATLRTFLDSDYFAKAKDDFTAAWDKVSTRQRFAYLQEWP
jgi:hypothetical protein